MKTFKRLFNNLFPVLISIFAFSIVSCSGANNQPRLEKIEITSLPNKTEYYVGEEFDKTGLEVLGTYSDEHTEKVMDYTLSDVDMSTEGIKEVVVSYLELQTSFNINVNIYYDPVYLIMGQSNASGNSLWRYLETKDHEVYEKFSTTGTSNVLFSYDNHIKRNPEFAPTIFGTGDDNHGVDAAFGPEIGMADILSQKTETTYIIRAALGGSALSQHWLDYSGSKNWLYDYMIDFIKTQLLLLKEQGVNPSIRGMFWMQGESDSQSRDLSNLYKEHEIMFFNYLQEDLSEYISEDFLILDAHISSRCSYWRNYQIVNQAKTEVSSILDNHQIITINGENDGLLVLNKEETGEENGDTAHFESLSMLNLGREVGRIFLSRQ